METEKSLWNKFTEWWMSHALWEASKTVLGVALSSFAWTKLENATAERGVNIFLLLVGVLGILWGVGILPIKRKGKPSPFSESRVQKCDGVILSWKVFAQDYGRNPNKEAGQAATVPNPTDMAWPTYGFKQRHYRVGFLQGKTYALLGGLKRAGIQVEEWDYSKLSMVQLLHALEKYQKVVASELPSLP